MRKIKRDSYGRLISCENNKVQISINYHNDFTDLISSKEIRLKRTNELILEEKDIRGRIIRYSRSVNDIFITKLEYFYKFYKGQWFCKITGLYNDRVITLNSTIEDKNPPINFIKGGAK